MSGPTPGPWRVGFSDGSGMDEECPDVTTVHEHKYRQGGLLPMVLANVEPGGLDYEIFGGSPIANAHLIAAAPEMAEVCEMAVALGAAHPDSERGQLVAAARAALAKARGEA